MGVHVIKMPDIGEGIAEVELVAWHIKPGDAVAEDQVLADVMTDKATVEIPSPVVGTVIALGGEIGQVMAVGSELIRIEVAGAGNVKDAPAAVAKAAAPAAPAAPTAPAAPASPAAPKPGMKIAAAPSRETAPRRHAGSAPARRQSPSLRRPCAAAPGIWASSCSSSRAAERPGRITHEDLDAYLRRAHAPVRRRQAAKAASRYAETDRRRGQSRDRSAPQDRAEDAGGQAPHTALHLRRRDRRHGTRGTARAAQREMGHRARPPHAAAAAGPRDRAGGTGLPAGQRALRRRCRHCHPLRRRAPRASPRRPTAG